MPIYEYRCANCGFQKEYLQRMSDPQLTDCPECKQSTLSKMVTAAGFQLKGGGWYVTDFKGGNKPAGGGKKTEEKQSDTSAKPESSSTESSTAEKPKSEPAAASSSSSASSGSS